MALPLISAGVSLGLGALSFIDAKNNAKMIQMAAEFRAKQLEFNAILVGMQKRDIFDQAQKDVLDREAMARQMIGAQRSSFASQNIQVDSEVAQQYKEQERDFSASDVATIRNNAWREAMGLDIQAMELRQSAKFSRLEGRSKARQTISAGFMDLASSAVGAMGKYADYKHNQRMYRQAKAQTKATNTLAWNYSNQSRNIG